MDASEQKVFDEDGAHGMSVVLLAEDDPIVRNLLLLTLHRASFAVLVAVDGEEAITLSRAFKGEISLLLTDMEMPSMGGDELGELIMQARPGIRILQISGRLASQFIGRNLSLAFLQKPFLPAALIEKIREVMAAPAGTRRAIKESHEFPFPDAAFPG
jgi:two-component system cell cycle sensor histidine kinase/response regulator CckA